MSEQERDSGRESEELKEKFYFNAEVHQYIMNSLTYESRKITKCKQRLHHYDHWCNYGMKHFISLSFNFQHTIYHLHFIIHFISTHVIFANCKPLFAELSKTSWESHSYPFGDGFGFSREAYSQLKFSS